MPRNALNPWLTLPRAPAAVSSIAPSAPSDPVRVSPMHGEADHQVGQRESFPDDDVVDSRHNLELTGEERRPASARASPRLDPAPSRRSNCARELPSLARRRHLDLGERDEIFEPRLTRHFLSQKPRHRLLRRRRLRANPREPIGAVQGPVASRSSNHRKNASGSAGTSAAIAATVAKLFLDEIELRPTKSPLLEAPRARLATLASGESGVQA